MNAPGLHINSKNLMRRQTFTMDMMLKSLNIELGVIGFDAENQRWEDGP